MSTSPEEVKRRAKHLIGAMMEIREETLQVPILRKRLIGFTNQFRQRQQLTPEEIRVIQQQGEQNPPTVSPQISFPFQRPKLLQQMPIRNAVGNLINALTVKSTGVTQGTEEQPAYEERQKELESSQMAQARLKRKGIYKEHGIEI